MTASSASNSNGSKPPGAADRLVAALAGTRAKALYAEAEEKAGTARAIGPDPELHRYLGDDYARKTRLAAEAAQAKAAADELVTAAAAGPLAAEEGFDRAALAQAASAAEVLRVVRTYVTRHRNGVAATSAELKADRAFGYDLPPLHELSLRLQDIREGTLYFRIVEDRLKSRQARKSVTAIVLAVVTLAISVATAGTGTVALLGALAVFGLGAWQAVEAYQEYRRGHGAHLAGLVQDDPWFGWVLVAVAGAGIDLAGAAAAIRPAEPALRLAKTTGDAARLAADLKAAGISERLAAGIVAQFRGAVGLDAALRDLAAAAGGVNSAIGGVRGIGPMVRAAYYGIRQGIVSLDRFVLRLRAARLLAEGELSAGELIRLRAAFEQAGTAGRRIRTLGTELGLSEEQLSAVVDSWGANPAWTLAEVEGRLRAVATGNVRAAYESVLANRPVLDRELSTVEQRIAAAAGRPNPADLARWDELTARLSRLREIDSVSVAPRGGRIVEVSLDEAAPNFFETVAPVVPDPPVVLEFPDGTRVWRTTAGGPVRHESTLGGSLGRAGMERGMYSAGQHGNLPSGPSYERAHTLGQGTGFESPYGIFYAPEFVNQRVQNEGIEAYLRTVAAGAHPGETFRVFTKVRPHPDTLRLATIDYRLVRVDQAGAEEVASYSIVVSSSAEHPVVTAGALRFAPTSTGRAMATRFPIPPQLTMDARFAY
ncbi:polymorphic toxin type 4 domain-containing protein [Amycolatopsis sp. NPDC004169]|uniref:polymorphic toxin type 4 domain-containing protein n=1 Tax=Amycolatopsis sp. NPDC004169 TaxID=3154453 RepID=UPI0033BC110D